MAAAAGVGKTTASDALRGDLKVAEATREKVLEAAARLGYRSNPLVNACMSHVRGARAARYQATIAVVTTGAEVARFEDLVDWEREFYLGAARKSEELGFAIDLVSLGPSHRAENVAKVLHSRGIHALYFLPLLNPVQALPWERYATVATGFSITRPVFDRVAIHFMQLAMLAFRKIAELGYRRPGLAIRREFDWRSDHSCVAGCLYSQQSLAIENRVPPLVYDDEDYTKALLDWYRAHRPDVVVGWDWKIADLLRKNGIRVPQKTGYVALAWYASRPDIAGTDHRRELQGGVAVENLASSLSHNRRGIPEEPKLVSVDGFWRDGPSLPPAPSK